MATTYPDPVELTEALHRARHGLMIAGGIAIVLGIVAPLHGTFTLTVMLVIWFVASGTARIIIGLAELGAPGAGMTALGGVVAVVLGVLIAEQLPSSAGWAIGLIVGVDLLVSRTVLVSLGLRLRVPGGAGRVRATEPQALAG
jgi:uncharacterized membrane protein HdeD (DUF308 family)